MNGAAGFTIENYLKHLPDATKRKQYAAAFEDLTTYGKTSSTFKCEMKSNEILYPEMENGKPKALRPRNLFNPPT